jgi:RNA polymerase sigma-70 factor, ECF subfamily
MSSIQAHEGGAAFEEIVVPLIADAYRTARRLARHDDDAQDLVQEALLRALRGFHRFIPGTNARAWLRTIVQSVFVTRYRRRQREPEIVGHDIERLSAEAWTGRITPWMALTASPPLEPTRISDPRLRSALDRLPPVFRDAVQLVDVDELTYEEAARELRCPVNTVRSRLFRGRRRLLAMLRDDGPLAGGTLRLRRALAGGAGRARRGH